jgi:hypothetical protein
MPKAPVPEALQLGTISFDAVKHLLLCRLEQRPPRLDLENSASATGRGEETRATDYVALLTPSTPQSERHSE